MHRLVILFIFISLSKINICCHTATTPQNIINAYVRVTTIVDGDTFWVDDGSYEGLKIRLIGVDAPESRKTGKKEIGYFGEEAKQYLGKRLAGRKVKLDFDVKKYDRYHRTLAYVYLEDGTFLNAELVKQGYAMVMTVPPNVKYAALFVKLAQEARNNNKGLWKQ